MTKPIDETWEVVEEGQGDQRMLYCVYDREQGAALSRFPLRRRSRGSGLLTSTVEIAQFNEWSLEPNETSAARAMLAAQAPAMARMLLRREYAVTDDGPVCAECGVDKYVYGPDGKESNHLSDCAWLAIMKAIGAR